MTMLHAGPSVRHRAGFAASLGLIRAAIGVRALLGDPGARTFLPGGRRDPYPHYHALRERGRLISSATGWTSASHDVVDAVLRDRRFGSAQHLDHDGQGFFGRLVSRALLDPGVAVTAMTSTPHPLGPYSLIGTDPPDHTRLRKLVSRAFTPRAVARWRPRVASIAHDLLDRAVPAGSDDTVDLVPVLASPLPVLVICELLGVPDQDHARFQRWGDALALTLDLMTSEDQRRTARALDELAVYFDTLFAQRRRDPGDEVIDVLLAAEADEPGLSSRELLATTLLLLAAGFETTVNLIGNGIYALLRHPEQLALLRAEPDRIPNAVEEMLRYDAPVQRDFRYATAPATIAGRTLAAGTPVSLLLGGANRDPAVFIEPERFDVTRGNASEHLAFASGIHYCLGAALARIEGEVAVAALLDRSRDLRLAAPPRRRRGLVLRGLTSLPVRIRS